MKAYKFWPVKNTEIVYETIQMWVAAWESFLYEIKNTGYLTHGYRKNKVKCQKCHIYNLLTCTTFAQ